MYQIGWGTELMTAPNPLDYSNTDVVPGWDHSIILPPIVKALRSIPPDGAVLDIGCGSGAMLAEIRKRGSWKLCGLDSSESAVSMARSQGFDVRLADATVDSAALFRPHSFDLIVSVEVIEHVYDPRGFLRQAQTLLRPNGGSG